MPDQSMLVLYPASSVIGLWPPLHVCGKAFSRSSQRHTDLSQHAGNPGFELPISLEFQSQVFLRAFRIPAQRTPLAFGNPKCRPWYR